MALVPVTRIAAQTPFLQGVPASFVSPPWYRFLAGVADITITFAASGVLGPGASVDGDIVLFDGATGTQVKDSGISIDTDGTLAANSNLRLPTQKAVKTYVDASAVAASQMYAHQFLLMGG